VAILSRLGKGRSLQAPRSPGRRRLLCRRTTRGLGRYVAVRLLAASALGLGALCPTIGSTTLGIAAILSGKEINCPSDAAALERAKQFADGCAVELWESKRFIARIDGHDKPA
jgi:hypothetical protein